MPNFIRARGPDGWLAAAADAGRLIGGAFYWNTAKTLFRLGGARGRAPCQHPSDSGREGESFCEACVGWSDPRRFARVCPLIRYDSKLGPRCSVAAAQVRPFWGRVLLGLALVGTVGAVMAAGAALLMFRMIGYQVTPSDLFWPPHWHRVHEARADYYQRRGVDAYARGDARACYLALSQAHALRPGDYATDRLLAQVAQTLDPNFADRLFGELVQSSDPLQAANAAEAWGPALLARGSLAPLARLSAYMLRRGGADAAVWTNALVFTSAQLADVAVVRGLLAAPGAPEADCREVLEWSLQAGSEKLNTALIAAGRSSPSQYQRYYALHRLIRSGQGAVVLQIVAESESVLGATRSTLSPREVEELQLSAWGALKQTELRRGEIIRLIGSGEVSPQVVELLAAHLISCPDRPAAAALFGAVERHPLAATAANYRVYAALVCLAGINHDAARINAFTARLGTITGRPLARTNQVSEILMDRTPGRSLSPALVALQPLSLEVMFALLAEDSPRPAAPAKPPQAQAAR